VFFRVYYSKTLPWNISKKKKKVVFPYLEYSDMTVFDGLNEFIVTPVLWLMCDPDF